MPMERRVHSRRVVNRFVPRRARGFTLVELSIVVAIVGVLAVIAVVGYRKYILHSKISEAQQIISAIRIAQEDYRAEKGTYANIGTNFCPAGAGTSDKKWGWNPACDGGSATWATLPVHVDGPVQFAYATVAGTTTMSGSPLNTTWVNWTAATRVPWYVVKAECDLDGDTSNKTELAGSSFQNTIFTYSEGM
jgi:type IV pilus assembly protein PilA